MKQVFLWMTAVLTLLFISCEDETKQTAFSEVTLTVSMPDHYNTLSPDGITITFTNVSNGVKQNGETDSDGKYTGTMEEGIYNILISGEKESPLEIGKTILLQGTKENVNISGATVSLSLSPEVAQISDSWVIKEIYTSGSKTAANKNYLKDAYFEIYNNSDKILYADGLILCETYATATTSNVDWKQFLPSRIAAGAMYQVPGDGTTYPVEPGKSIVIADQAQDHKGNTDLNPNSPVNLSNANFEWYDDHKTDIDNPAVTNMKKIFCYSATIWVATSQMNRGFFIFKIPANTTVEEFLDENYVEADNAAGTKKLPAYAIPAELILDGVDLAEKDKMETKTLPSSIDAGYSHGEGIGSGLSIQRKISRRENGRVYLQDTNNSTNDFLTGQKPSPFTVPNE